MDDMYVNSEMVMEQKIVAVFQNYGIEDATYLRNCQEALNLLKNNEALQKMVEWLCDSLYCKCEYETVEKIRATAYDELFGEFSQNRFLTNLVALVGLARNMDCRWKENIHNILFYGRDGMRVRQMVFLSYIITNRMVERDGFRFQYVTGKKDANIVLHMTKEARLEMFQDVFLRMAEDLKRKWELTQLQLVCESWMLSAEIADCLPKESHILAFRKHFVISCGPECTVDILKFVFGIYETEQEIAYAELPERTSLQRKVKEKLSNGETFYFGIGRMEE